MYDSEKTVVGTILVDSRALAVVRPLLSLADFKTSERQAVFRAACSLEDDGLIADPVLIRERAAERGAQLDAAELADLMEYVTASANLPAHAQAMKNFMFRSRLLDAISAAQGELLLERDPNTVCATLQADVERAVTESGGNTLVDGDAAILEYVDYRVDLDEGKKRSYIPTGFNALDNALGGGMVQSGLYILAARPGCGKTAMGLQIAEKVAASGVPVLFVSLEMPTLQLTGRRLAAETGMPAARILMHSMTDEEHNAVAEASDKLRARPLMFNSVGAASVGSIGVLARQMKNCGLVIVDYLGLLQYEQGRTLYEQVTKTSNALKRLALSLGLPILCLAQLNRELEGRKGPPRLSDLRDSGAIEQDADAVLLLHQLQAEEGELTPLVCSIAKNRHGRAGVDVELAWSKTNGRILPTKYQPAVCA